MFGVIGLRFALSILLIKMADNVSPWLGCV